jgi:membrane-associated phospholipid phosphatase
MIRRWLLAVALIVIGIVGPAQMALAQVGEEPTAWAPDHRALADGIGTALVGVQAAAETVESVRAWRDGDHKPAWVNLCAGVAAVLTSEGLKRVVHEMRPDGSDKLSWPSGHSMTLAALAGNSTRRFGWGFSFSIPVAAMGGVSRAWANKHHLVGGDMKVGDVTSGLAIGALERWMCTVVMR